MRAVKATPMVTMGGGEHVLFEFGAVGAENVHRQWRLGVVLYSSDNLMLTRI